MRLEKDRKTSLLECGLGVGRQKNVSLGKGVLRVSEVPSGGGTDTVRVRLPFLPSVTIEMGVIYTVRFVC